MQARADYGQEERLAPNVLPFLKNALLTAAAVCLSSAVAASGSASEAGGAGAFVQRLYNYPPNVFDLGKFGGRYQPKKRCALMKEFFSGDLLKDGKSGDCDAMATGDTAFRRYPSLGPEDLGPDSAVGRLPKAQIIASRLLEGRAVVKVGFKGDSGRIVYFLRTTEHGWRIENALSYPLWPISMPPQGCSQLDAGGYFYLRNPSSLEELEDLPKQCREVERRYLDDRSRRHAHPTSHP